MNRIRVIRIAVAVVCLLSIFIGVGGEKTVLANQLAGASGGYQWPPMMTGGFGTVPNTTVSALQVYNGKLYAGTINGASGGSVWRTTTGTTWEQVVAPGVISLPNNNYAILAMTVFQNKLYVSTGWGGSANDGQVWQFDEAKPVGSQWVKVMDNTILNGFTAFGIFNNNLYVGATVVYANGQGTEIYRSPTGEPNSWTKVVSNGNNSPTSYSVNSLVAFNNALYAAVADDVKGIQIWKMTLNGAIETWTNVVNNGFGDTTKGIDPGGMTVFNGKLYIGIRNGPLAPATPADSLGGKIFSTSDGATWSPAAINGLGNAQNVKIEGLYVLGTNFFALTSNPFTGMEVWVSPDGTNWNWTANAGFDNPNNTNPLWNSSVTDFNNHLVVGTNNPTNGGAIYQGQQTLTNHVFLPFITR